LQNKEEVQGDKGINVDDPKAKYKLVSPDWKYIKGEDALSYKDGKRLLRERAEKYQAEQLALFEQSKK
jgi:hypothetical protein